MSTLRNAAPRRTHLERHQPTSRTRSHPLLEKHKDYALRARDHNLKQSKLKILHQKAAARNPDEFVFGMVGGGEVKRKRGLGNIGGLEGGEEDERERGKGNLRGRVKEEMQNGKGLSSETVMLLKGQDRGYVRIMRDRVRKQKERLQRKFMIMHGLRDAHDEPMVQVVGVNEHGERGGKRDAADPGSEDEADLVNSATANRRRRHPQQADKHTVFVSDTTAQSSFSPTAHFNTTSAGLNRSYNRPRLPETPLQHLNSPLQPTSTNAPSRNSKHIHGPLPSAEDKLAPFRRKKLAKAQARQRAILAALDKQEHELATAERELDAQRAKMRGDVGATGVNRKGVKWKIRGRKP